MWNYISTIYKGYNITTSTTVRIKFDDTISEYLVFARDNFIEIHEFKNEILTLRKEIEIFEHIIRIKRIQSPVPTKSDYLFILAESMNYCFCNLDNGILTSKFHGTATFNSFLAKGANTINLITDIQFNSLPNMPYYLAISAYKNFLFMITFKFKSDAELIVEKNSFIKFEYDDLLDIIPIDAKHFKASSQLIGVLSMEPLKKYPIFHIVEYNSYIGEINKKIIWDIQFIKDMSVYKVLPLFDGGILTFSEISIK